MQTFEYLCMDDLGARRRGSLKASDLGAAKLELEGRGWVVLSLGGETFSESSVSPALLKLSLQVHSRICLKLSLLMGSGVSIVDALDAAARDESAEVAGWLSSISARVAGGYALSRALEETPAGLEGPVIALVRLGEETGRLVHLLSEISESTRTRLERIQELKTKLTYPAIQLAVVGSLCVLLGAYLGPQLASVVEGVGGEAPALTRWVTMAFSPTPMAVLFALGLTVLVTAVSTWSTPAGKQARRQVIESIPPLRTIQSEMLLTLFCRSLAMMLESGFDWRKGLALSGTGHQGFDQAVESFGKKLESSDFKEAVAECDVFPKLLKSLLTLGYEVNRTPMFLNIYAEMLEDSVRLRISVLIALLEPLLLCALGLLVGVVVVASFLPIMSLVEQL